MCPQQKTVQKTAAPILISIISSASVFFVAYFYTVPAISQLGLQMAVHLIFNLIALYLLFIPAMYYDLIRMNENRMDLACCKVAKSTSEPGSGPDLDNVVDHRPTCCEGFSQLTLSKALSNNLVRLGVFIVALVGGAVLIFVALGSVESGLTLSELAKDGSYVKHFSEVQENVFAGYENFVVHDFSTVGGGFLASSNTKTFQQEILDVQVDIAASKWISDGVTISDTSWFACSDASFLGFFRSVEASQSCSNPIETSGSQDTEDYFDEWVLNDGAIFSSDVICEDPSGSITDCVNWVAGTGYKLVAAKESVINQGLNEHDDFIDAIDSNRGYVDGLELGGGWCLLKLDWDGDSQTPFHFALYLFSASLSALFLFLV